MLVPSQMTVARPAPSTRVSRSRHGTDAYERFERWVFVAWTIAAVGIVFFLPVVPGHDVPQHLSYVRLIAAWENDPHALADVFTAPDVSNAYATVYRLLAPIARHTSAETALRIGIIAYVVLTAMAVRRLVRATWCGSVTPISSLLGPVVALNPVLCMGLIPFAFSLAPFVGACASFVEFLSRGRRRDWIVGAISTAITASFHGFAVAALVTFLALVFVFRRERRAFFALGVCAASAFGTLRWFGGAARLPVGIWATLAENMRRFGVVTGTLGTFRVSFTNWVEKVDQVAASIFGPFPRAEKLICVALVGVVVAVVFVCSSRSTPPVDRARVPSADDDVSFDSAHPFEFRAVPGVRAAMVAFAVLAILAPAAIQIPDDLSLIDFRLITTATILGVAVVPPTTLSVRRTPRLIFAGVSALALAIWARQLGGAASEVMQAVRLVDRLTPEDRVLALPMHDSSAYLDESNAVLHYEAVHHTARNAGITSLFWGRFSTRLPIGYRTGREPSHPFDWAPWELRDEQLAAFSHVLVRWPSLDDEERLRRLGMRVENLRSRGVLSTVACDGSCCLFEVVDRRAER